MNKDSLSNKFQTSAMMTIQHPNVSEYCSHTSALYLPINLIDLGNGRSLHT
jgi:hypothetical protein